MLPDRTGEHVEQDSRIGVGGELAVVPGPGQRLLSRLIATSTEQLVVRGGELRIVLDRGIQTAQQTTLSWIGEDTRPARQHRLDVVDRRSLRRVGIRGLQGGDDELGLVGEPAVHGRSGDAGPVGDLLDADRADAPLDQFLQSGIKDRQVRLATARTTGCLFPHAFYDTAQCCIETIEFPALSLGRHETPAVHRSEGGPRGSCPQPEQVPVFLLRVSLEVAMATTRPRTDGRSSLGLRGEDVAADYLTGLGYRVVARNWRCRTGEIDLIARIEHEGRSKIIFCEVKTRAGLGYGHPLEAITYAKQQRLRQLAGVWLSSTGERADDLRMDAIGVLLLPGERPQVSHVPGIDR